MADRKLLTEIVFGLGRVRAMVDLVEEDRATLDEVRGEIFAILSEIETSDG